MKKNPNEESFPVKEIAARHKKTIKNVRGLRDSINDELSFQELHEYEFGNEISIANIWDNPVDDIS